LTFFQLSAGAQDAQSPISSSWAGILADYPKGSTLGMVTGEKVRVRSKPSRNSAIVTSLNAGALALVLSQSGASENLGSGRHWWYQVKLRNGVTGWIYGEFLFLFKTDSDFQPLMVSVGSRHYSLVRFDHVVDPSPRNELGEVDSMPAFIEQGAYRALPIRIDQRTAEIKNPDGWYMIRATLDEGSESITDTQSPGDDIVRVTVETKDGDGTFDLQLTCALRNDQDRPYFEVRSFRGSTDFFLLVKNGPVDLVREAIRQGVDINARNSDGMTPLLVACVERDEPTREVISVLLSAGANPNVRTPGNDATPLMWAAESKEPGTVEMLLKAGADAKARDSSGKTAFDHAQGNEKLKGTDAWRLLQGASN